MEVVQHDLKAANIKVSEVESRLTEQNRQLDAALSDRLELEAKVEAASDERRSLLERCLGAEGELDRSRSTLVELRRKLGMIPHKKSLITIFGYKHKIKNFIKKFDIFH